MSRLRVLGGVAAVEAACLAHVTVVAFLDASATGIRSLFLGVALGALGVVVGIQAAALLRQPTTAAMRNLSGCNVLLLALVLAGALGSGDAPGNVVAGCVGLMAVGMISASVATDRRRSGDALPFA